MSESNNNTPMRITQLEEATSYPEGAYLPIAKAGYGTKKILASVKRPIEDALVDGDVKTLYAIRFSITYGGQYSVGASGYLVKVNAGDNIVLKNSVRQSYFAILKSKNNMYRGGYADFATDYPSIYTFGANKEITIPADGNYLWLYGVASGVDYYPTYLTINGYNALISERENIIDLMEANKGLPATETQVFEVDNFDKYKVAYSINGSGKWQLNGYNAGVIVPCNPNDIVFLQKVGTGYYSVLKTNKTASGATPDFATGFTGYKTYNPSTTFEVPEDGNFIWMYISDGTHSYIPKVFEINGLNAFYTLKGNVTENVQNIKALDGKITSLEENSSSVDVSLGRLDELSPFNGTNLSFAQRPASKTGVHKRIVAVNHDDLQASDYINIRKVYNKFGFHANFNFILMPFSNGANKTEKISNVKKLIGEGHKIGLHAIFQESFWWMNKMFDVTPTSGTTFSPTLSELKTDVGSGKNVFGQTIDLTKPLSYYGFASVPSSLASKAIGNLTSSEYFTTISNYTFFNSAVTYAGLDLEDSSKTWTMLQWLEHWYNNLIDDSLGYSTITGTVAERFAADYEVPEGEDPVDYYPDAEHLLNGKIVFFDDTSNPNYSDDSYQKVGRFSKGLYKGAASTCNYEVRSRCIEIAKAFCLHYFGSNNFTVYGRHGVSYVDVQWKNNNVPYENRDCSVLCGEFGKVFNSISMKWENGVDVLLSQGIRMTTHNTPINPVFESQYSLYHGQYEKRSPFMGVADLISYLTLAGNTASFDGSSVNNANLIKILSEHEDNLIKFIYEKAGTQVTSKDGTVSMYIHRDLKLAIDTIRATFDTGKIPFLSLDTIVNDAANIYGVELLSRYCYYNDVEVVPIEDARVEAISKAWDNKSNYFPNPKFNQSLLKMFGGDSTSFEAYLPDGWKIIQNAGLSTISVSESDGVKILNVSGNGTGENYVASRLWGLPSGDYRITFSAKSTGGNGAVFGKMLTNSTKVQTTFGANIFAKYLSQTDTESTFEFTIPEPEENLNLSSPESIYSNGYEDSFVEFRFVVALEFGSTSSAGETVSIHDIKLERI